MNSPLLKLFNESLNARAIVEGIKKQQQKKNTSLESFHFYLWCFLSAY